MNYRVSKVDKYGYYDKTGKEMRGCEFKWKEVREGRSERGNIGEFKWWEMVQRRKRSLGLVVVNRHVVKLLIL